MGGKGGNDDAIARNGEKRTGWVGGGIAYYLRGDYIYGDRPPSHSETMCGRGGGIRAFGLLGRAAFFKN